ncbi:MAG TPA: aldo/keto reductase [Xanthobacteraceae bacterium]|nr:aldo/keto reductase [Xanthobacteraceae bacterium]
MHEHEMPALSRRQVMALGVGAAAGALVGASAEAQAAILTRPIPHSGEMLPVVGLGTARVFNVGDDAGKRAEVRKVIEALVAGGAKLIDTAAAYGSSEGVVGDVVDAARLRDKVFLATKIAVRDRAASIAEMEQGRRRLRTQKIDLEQLHNVRDPNTDLGLFREWKAAGICRYIGITTSFNGDHGAVAAVVAREKPDFVQVNYSIADREAEKRVLPAAKDAGAAVLINEPLGTGGLFRLVRGKALPDWAAEFDAATWGQFFLKYLIANEAVTAVIPATSKAEHMVDNLGAGRGKLPDKAMRARMVAFIDGL